LFANLFLKWYVLILLVIIINKIITMMKKQKIVKNGKDLTKEAPRSPHIRLGGFVVLARTIDKCQALLWGNIGEYHFDCPLDKTLFTWKGIMGDDFKKFLETGVTDDKIVEWVKKNGISKTESEIATWSTEQEADNYSTKPQEKKKWLSESAVKLGLSPDATLFDYLDADDKASFSETTSLPKVCEI
jgi:hypothetical protein